MPNNFKEVLGRIEKDVPSGLKVEHDISQDVLILYVEPKEISRLMYYLRDSSGCFYKQLVDITCVDKPQNEKRFEIVYQLLSLKHNDRIRVKLYVSADDIIPSLCAVYSSANWMEREVFDMYGVKFSDHPDLRRILTDYGFVGYPQRKDFPLTGHVEVSYSEERKSVVYEPVKLDQEFRSFDFQSPWEGAEYALEKQDGEG